MSYYSPNEILTSSIAARSTFLLTVPGLGFLSSAATPDIQKKQTLPLPLYLASFLAHQSLGAHPAITHDFPDFLEARVMNALKADPKSVDLRALCAFFYEGAAACLEGLEDENEIVGVLEESFKQRAAQIADHANNTQGAMGGDGVEFLRGLDEMERELFRAAHDGAKAVRVWMGETKK